MFQCAEDRLGDRPDKASEAIVVDQSQQEESDNEDCGNDVGELIEDIILE